MPLQQGGMSLAARQPLELLHLLPMPPFASKVKMQQWLPAQVSALGKARQWRRELRRPRPRRPFGGQCRWPGTGTATFNARASGRIAHRAAESRHHFSIPSEFSSSALDLQSAGA